MPGFPGFTVKNRKNMFAHLCVSCLTKQQVRRFLSFFTLIYSEKKNFIKSDSQVGYFSMFSKKVKPAQKCSLYGWFLFCAVLLWILPRWRLCSHLLVPIKHFNMAVAVRIFLCIVKLCTTHVFKYILVHINSFKVFPKKLKGSVNWFWEATG